MDDKPVNSAPDSIAESENHEKMVSGQATEVMSEKIKKAAREAEAAANEIRKFLSRR